MPIPLIIKGVTEGLSSIPYIYTVLKVAPWVLLVGFLKFYFGGARNQSERLMHSKVVMVTVCHFSNWKFKKRKKKKKAANDA